MTLPETYTLQEVANALGMSERWLRQKVKDGATHLRAGQKIKFTEEQYELLRADLTKHPVEQSVTTGRGRKQ